MIPSKQIGDKKKIAELEKSIDKSRKESDKLNKEYQKYIDKQSKSGPSGSSGSSMAADLYAQAHKDEETFRKMKQDHAESKGKLAKMIHEMSQKDLDVADLET